jgi:hypothetical protein
MPTYYNTAILIDTGAAADYPGRFKGFFQGKCGSPEAFVAQTHVNLRKIYSKPIGKDLLDLILKRHHGIGTKKNADGTGKTVTICNGWGTQAKGDNNTDASATNNGAKFVVKKQLGGGNTLAMAGQGSSVKVRYSVTLDYTSILKLKTPAFVALAHELIHAYHFLSGNQSSDLSMDPVLKRIKSSIIEEALTVGAGTYANTRISENAIRLEHGLPLREFYNVAGDCDIKR